MSMANNLIQQKGAVGFSILFFIIYGFKLQFVP